MKRILGICVLCVGLIIVSCSKKDYFDDTGVHNPLYNGNMIQFLEENAKDSTSLFDTLVTVIKLAGLEGTLASEEVTFFAPTDPSIGRAVKQLNSQLFADGRDTVERLEQINGSVWKKILQGYIIPTNKGLTDFSQVDTVALNSYGGQFFQTLDVDLTVNIGVVYHDLKNGDVTIKYQGPRQLIYSYISDMSRPLSFWTTGYVATSNIQPTNGRLHILRFTDHTFGFRPLRFSSLAIEKGINYN